MYVGSASLSPLTVLPMTTPQKLIVKGRGPEAPRVIVVVEVYRGKVRLTSFDCPFTAEAIFEPAQADSLVELINQAIKETRGYKNGPAS